jgi:hypothetical protein
MSKNANHHGNHHKPPPKRDRVADGWELIGYYMERDGIVWDGDATIGANLKWKTAQGVGDARRVRDVRFYVTKQSHLEAQRGMQPGDPKAVYRRWCFEYRDIEGHPSVLHEVDGSPFDAAKGTYALLGTMTRLRQHDTERERIAQNCRAAATDTVARGRPDIAVAYLDIARDIELFGIPTDPHLEALRQLLESWV